MPPKCPHCGKELEYDELIDHYGDYDTCSDIWFGWCPSCARKYRWIEVFTFSHYEQLEEEELE